MLIKTQAFYFDGQTSVPHNTELILNCTAKELSFAKSDGTVSNSIYEIEYEIHNDKMEIKFKNEEMPIVVEDKNFIDETKNIFGSRATIYQKLVNLKFKTHLLLGVVVFFLIAVAYIFITPVVAKKAVLLIPVAVDAKLGELFMEKYSATVKIDSAKTLLLNEFAGKITWNNKVKLNFLVIEDSNTVNAFALPNGDIIIFTALLNRIEDYETLAALLSHEVSHINKRHSMQIICKSLAGYALISVLTTDISALTAVILENAGKLNDLSYSRDMELEADESGFVLLEENNINPAGMLNLMETLPSGFFDVEFLSTHPIMEKRIENVKSRIGKKEYVKNPELERAFGVIKNLRYPP